MWNNAKFLLVGHWATTVPNYNLYPTQDWQLNFGRNLYENLLPYLIFYLTTSSGSKPCQDIVPTPSQSTSILHGWNQTFNMKCLCRCLPDENTSGNLKHCKWWFVRTDFLFPLLLCPVFVVSAIPSSFYSILLQH